MRNGGKSVLLFSLRALAHPLHFTLPPYLSLFSSLSLLLLHPFLPSFLQRTRPNYKPLSLFSFSSFFPISQHCLLT